MNRADENGAFSKEQLSKTFQRILNNISVILKYIIEHYGVSNKKYLKLSKYKDVKQIYTVVKNNKGKLKSFKNSFSGIATALSIIIEIVSVAKILKKNNNIALRVAELIFYAVKNVFQYALSTFLSWAVTAIFKPLVVLKYAIKTIFEYIIEDLMDKYEPKILKSYLNEINTNRMSFENILYAFFVGIKNCRI